MPMTRPARMNHEVLNRARLSARRAAQQFTAPARLLHADTDGDEKSFLPTLRSLDLIQVRAKRPKTRRLAQCTQAR
jgi:hypothetical protein